MQNELILWYEIFFIILIPHKKPIGHCNTVSQHPFGF